MIETHPTLAQQEFIAREMLHRRNVKILRTALLILLLALWELCARLGIINDFIFSSPSRILVLYPCLPPSSSPISGLLLGLDRCIKASNSIGAQRQ